MIELALKVDVDTLKGYLEGVPRLLRIFGDRDIKATFLFSFGPDNSGKAIWRVFRKGFLTKMFRTRAPSAYGLKTLMYGTLLPAPMIVGPSPRQFELALESGHDCGIHAWDHVKWQDNIKRLSKDEISDELHKAAEVFKRYSGSAPRCFGAPGWQVSEASLAAQDELGLDYCSDTRGAEGSAPFLPTLGGRKFHTPQIPSTLPTLDEVLGSDGVSTDNFDTFYLGLLKDGLNVHTIHTEMEGGQFACPSFERFIDRCLGRGVIFKTLSEVAAKARETPIPTYEIRDAHIPGRSGKVSVPGA